MQAKHSFQKGCKLFVVQFFSDEKANDSIEEEEIEVLEKYVLQKFRDVFLVNIQGFPPLR